MLLFYDFFVCILFSVFCFLCSLIPLKTSSLKCFNKFVVIYQLKYTRGQSGQRPKLCISFRVWYCYGFSLQTYLLFLWFWDKKKVKKSQKGLAKKVYKCQTWINSAHVWNLPHSGYCSVLCVLKILILCRHCHLCVSVVTQIRPQCCPCPWLVAA